MARGNTESLSTVVSRGDRRLSLIALRDKLAEELETTFGKDCAPLAQRLAIVLAEIESLSGAKKGDAVDEVAKKRAARRAGTAGTAGS